MDVRLKGPSSINGSGHVEIFYKGQWGSICDWWSINSANVVCRQLGYTNAIRAFGDYAGQSFKLTLLRRVRCIGNEQHLRDCPYIARPNGIYCRHRFAGVECSFSGKALHFYLLA